MPPDCYCTSVKTTWRTASLIQDHAEPAPTFLLDPKLRRFRIIRCNRQAALGSAIFNYTPLVIGGADKNKQLTNIKQHKLALTAINELFELQNHQSL